MAYHRSAPSGAVSGSSVIRYSASCVASKVDKAPPFLVPLPILKTCPQVFAEQALPAKFPRPSRCFLEATSRRCAHGKPYDCPLQAVIQRIGYRERALVQHRTQYSNPFGAQPFGHSQRSFAPRGISLQHHHHAIRELAQHDAIGINI